MSITKKILGSQADARTESGSTRFNGDLDAMARYWAQRTANTLKANLIKKNIKLTGELIDSVTWQVNDGDIPGVSIFFASQGRILEMKTLFWVKPPPFNAILKWVKTKPISTWAFVPGYEYRTMNGIPTGMDQDKAQKRIAWGIVMNRASGEPINQAQKWGKKKQWQNPSGKANKANLNTAMAHLKNLLIEEIGAAAAGRIITTITQ